MTIPEVKAIVAKKLNEILIYQKVLLTSYSRKKFFQGYLR